MKRNLLTPRDAEWLNNTLARRRAQFAGWSMEADPKAPPKSGGAPKSDDDPGDDPDDGKGSKTAVLADLAKERKARQALEQQVADLAPLKDQMAALAEAFGVKPAKGSDADDTIIQVQDQLAAMQHDNAVLRLANQHKITDEDDLALLASAKDADAMAKLAPRLAGKDSDADDDPGTPKPDLSQGPKGEPVKQESPPGVPRMAQAFEDAINAK